MSWPDRFRAPRWDSLAWARDRPDRAVLLGNPTGTWEVYSWAGTGRPVQATSRPHGTNLAAVDPGGRQVWWFADTGGSEHGTWRAQAFGAGPGQEHVALPGVPAAYPAGLALGGSGLVVVGCSGPDGTTVYRVRPGGTPRVLYRHRQDASVADLSRDEELVLVEHSEHGDSRHRALRVVTGAGAVVGDLWDGPGRGLSAVGFSPTGHTVLARHERRGRSELLLWEPTTGEVTELAVELPGELSARFDPDGRSLLVICEHEARASAWRHDLLDGGLRRLGPADGSVTDACPRPAGAAWLTWSSAQLPPQVLALPAGTPLLPPAGPVAEASVPAEDLWTDGPAGRIHTLLSRPPAPAADPPPAVFLVHGGPTFQDRDAFSPAVAAWVDCGFLVARVNYRGSTGYGSGWRDALEQAPGLTELADLAAVRDRLAADGAIDPARTVLAGGSWGGFLTLLGLGTQPDRWACGVAAVPVADYFAAYEDEMESLQAFDRSLFGGSPEEVPERYRQASPLTYVEAVRAPVLVLAGANDPRCPLRQIENYLAALAERKAEHEVYRFDAGHGSLVTEERIRQTGTMIDFVRRRLPP